MTPEIMEVSALDRLDIKHRNELQNELMYQMLGEDSTEDEQLSWVLEFGKKVSDLIDYHEHDEIRSLALEENYTEAAKLLRGLLEE